jgi:hypothetical protein
MEASGRLSQWQAMLNLSNGRLKLNALLLPRMNSTGFVELFGLFKRQEWAEVFRSQPLNPDEVRKIKAQAEQDLDLLQKQIQSLVGAHGAKAYDKAGELLTEARRLTQLIQSLK